MKRTGLLLLAILIPFLCFAEAQEYLSPVVHPDRTATLKILAPNATEVAVQGSFTTKPIPMEKDPNGIWTVTVGPLKPERHEYSFLVVGAKVIDPRNREVKKWRILDSVLEIPGDPPLRHELRPIPHGTVHRHWYESTSLGRTRGLFIYTPPSYDFKGTERYPVLFLLHGMGDDESAWLEVGKANFIADSLIAEGKARSMVIVMPYGHAVPSSRTRSQDFAGNTEYFARDLLEDVIPFVRARYSVREDAKGQAIVGLSMGGGQSTTIGLHNPDKFAWIGGFSSSVSDQRADERFSALILDVEESNQQIELLWIGCGKSDFLYKRNKGFISWLESKNIDHIYRESEGGHTWRVWRKYLAEFLPLLFVENRRQSILEDAKLRGIDFRGTGNEPGWSLEIGPDNIVFITNYGDDRYALPTPTPEVNRGERKTTYRARGNGHELIVVLEGKECRDTMADDTFETTVTVTLDGKSVNGCGTALH